MAITAKAIAANQSAALPGLGWCSLPLLPPPNGLALQRPGYRTSTVSGRPTQYAETSWMELFPGPLQGLVRRRWHATCERGAENGLLV